jgi:hypothetical protein
MTFEHFTVRHQQGMVIGGSSKKLLFLRARVSNFVLSFEHFTFATPLNPLTKSHHFQEEPRMSTNEDTKPQHWSLLHTDDQLAYMTLKVIVERLAIRTSRDRAAQNFRLLMTRLQEYIIRHDEDDWKRSLVCGIAWLGDTIAISTTQLRKLMGKCKSSVNNGFQSIGFIPAPMSADCAEQLTCAIPLMREDLRETRKWTVRTPCEPLPVAFALPISLSPDLPPSGLPDLTMPEHLWSEDEDTGLFLGDMM